MNGKGNEIVKYEDGVLTGPPVHLAKMAKSMGWESFKFNRAKASYGGARNLINSVEEMLRSGMKDVSIDPELMKRMLANPPAIGHSSGDYAAALGRFINPSAIIKAIVNRNPADLLDIVKNPHVSDLQKRQLRRLNRICKASAAAYNSMKANPVFDANGELKVGNESSTLGHQAETFMRLTSVRDRVAYLKMLYPVNTQRYYAAFTKELERRGKTFYVGNNVTLSPTDYFKEKMLWRFSHSKYQAQVDLSNDFARFNGYNFALKTT